MSKITIAVWLAFVVAIYFLHFFDADTSKASGIATEIAAPVEKNAKTSSQLSIDPSKASALNEHIDDAEVLPLAVEAENHIGQYIDVDALPADDGVVKHVGELVDIDAFPQDDGIERHIGQPIFDIENHLPERVNPPAEKIRIGDENIHPDYDYLEQSESTNHKGDVTNSEA